MEEMRALIGRRQAGELTPVARTRSSIFDAPRSLPSSGSDEVSRKLEDLISDADKNLLQALSRQEALQDELKNLATQFREVGCPSPRLFAQTRFLMIYAEINRARTGQA